MGPQLKDQCAVKEICQPGELPWGSACYSWVANVHFRPPTMARLGVLSTCTCWAKAAAQDDEEFGHPGKLVRVQQVVILLTDPHFAAHGRHLSAQVQIITRQVPLRHAPHAGNLNEVIGAC
jgi:hypothetical protein